MRLSCAVAVTQIVDRSPLQPSRFELTRSGGVRSRKLPSRSRTETRVTPPPPLSVITRIRSSVGNQLSAWTGLVVEVVRATGSAPSTGTA